jgi:hypothetical protein
MNRQELLSQAHDRAVLNAIHEASNDLFKKHREQDKMQDEKQTIESRFEKIEKRLEIFESVK